MAGQIDYDLGVHKRTVNGMGLDIYMYVNQPGVYLNAHGNEVTEDLARQAGFEVDKHLKQRKLRAALSEAEREIRARMDAAQDEKKVVVSRRGYTLVDIGLDQFRVYDPDGDLLTKEALSKAQAQIVFDKLVPEGEVSAPAQQ